MRIRRLGVVGAGTMGGGIAALAASAGVPVVLLDVPGRADRNAVARGGLERAKKSKPAAFMAADRAAAIEIGNTEDDLEASRSATSSSKRSSNSSSRSARSTSGSRKLLPAHTIVASNTSGIPMKLLTDGRRRAIFASRFLGMHFFNPPRYLHLLEIIPTPETSSETIDAVRRFSDRILGKGIVVAKDVPGFVANRLGVFGMVLAIRHMEKHGLTIDEADVLTGVLTGRSKSATYRTADLSGIDVIAHVTQRVERDDRRGFLALVMGASIWSRPGQVGEKSGAGFYKRVGKEIQTLDWRTGEYRPQPSPRRRSSARLGAAAASPSGSPRSASGRATDERRVRQRISTAVLALRSDDRRLSSRYDMPAVDHAMEWGYAWEAGPFKQMDLLGADFLRRGFAELGARRTGVAARGEERLLYGDDGTTRALAQRRLRGRSARAGRDSARRSSIVRRIASGASSKTRATRR